MLIDPRDFSRDALLRDGGSIHLRAIRSDDKERLRAHFSRLGELSRYFRFMGVKKELTPEELARFTELDFVDAVGLAATLTRDGEERFIGVGRYFVVSEPGEPLRAEVAFAVEDAQQGRGIGTILLEQLACFARARGIRELEAETLSANTRMMDVFRSCGYAEKESMRGGVYHVVLDAEETEVTREAIDKRELAAAASSLRAILEPRSVALVGASRDPGTISGAILENLVRGGFQGELYPVNPRAAEIAGRRAYASVSAIGRPVDLAVVAVPAQVVPDVVADCAHAEVRGLVVISSGFAEVSPEGRAVQTRIRDVVRAAGMRMVGPNCMGVLNTDPAVRLNASFSPVEPPRGNIGMLTQSGAMGLALLDWATELHLGVSTFVSVGNKADISGNDLLAYWSEDERTKVVVLYLESFGNGRKFARIAPVVARKKPIVAVKSGRTEAGRRAAASHSAALASADIAVDALFDQAGVIRTRTMEELLDVVSLVSTQPLPRGPRVGIVTNAGGPGIMLADACEAEKLEVPRLGATTLDALRARLPPAAGLVNPIDMIASATPDQFERTIELVGNDDGVDAVICIYIPPLVSRPEEVAAAIARGAGKVPAEKPVLCVFISAKGAPPELSAGPRGALPVYAFAESAALALAAALRYARWKARPKGSVVGFDRAVEAQIRARVAAMGPGWAAPEKVAELLALAGIPLVRSEVVAAGDAVAAAERAGYPVVVKAVAEGVQHKSDAGLVLMDLGSAVEVEEAVSEVRARTAAIGAELSGVLVQPMLRGGLEMIVGVTADPVFGPLLVCGLGGVEVELLKDVAFHLTPVTDTDAREMLGKLRSSPLLDGYRGRPKRDRAALEQLLLRVSALVELVPELAELDLNPVLVLEEGAIAVDARMRLV